ncbi:hypothetical protein [Microbacterium sp. A93]|uniref:hypothetical protein n=1 Tax=Microbacterium sp. A93 TaxID=3450716 RepID=UPI003F42D527
MQRTYTLEEATGSELGQLGCRADRAHRIGEGPTGAFVLGAQFEQRLAEDATVPVKECSALGLEAGVGKPIWRVVIVEVRLPQVLERLDGVEVTRSRSIHVMTDLSVDDQGLAE